MRWGGTVEEIGGAVEEVARRGGGTEEEIGGGVECRGGGWWAGVCVWEGGGRERGRSEGEEELPLPQQESSAPRTQAPTEESVMLSLI